MEPWETRGGNDDLMSSNSFRPLYWPFDIFHLGSFEKFMSYFPVIGPQARAKRLIADQLRERTEECLGTWGDDRHVLHVFQICSHAIERAFKWPNRYYLTDDSFDILFWDWTGDLLAVEASLGIEARLRIPSTTELNLMECSENKQRYGEVIRMLTDLVAPQSA